MDTLFELPKAEIRKIGQLPVSVLDIGAQSQDRRVSGGHDKYSSRTEYSHFPHEVANLCYQLYLNGSTLVVDPFAGWGERASASVAHGVPYRGYDLSVDAIEYADKTYGVQNVLADSLSCDVPTHDGLITCPPYWDLEKYNGGGLSDAKSWCDFLCDYSSILRRFADRANPHSKYCIMTGDWRSDGTYYDLGNQTRRIMCDHGWSIFDEVIVSRKLITKIKIMIPQAVRLGYTVKVHETLLVFTNA